MDKNNVLNLMIANNDIEITPCEDTYIDRAEYQKAELSPSQKSQMSMLVSQMPTLLAADALSRAYTVRFPSGLPHTLMTYKNGGVGSPIMGEHGIIGHAGFYEMSAAAAMMSAFSTMSLVTGQYFMTEINNNLTIITQKMDKIIDFLYGDKKAELISEISFIRYANHNLKSIMLHDQQKTATITSIQAAKKVAVQDIEFYLSDLAAKVNAIGKSKSDFKDAMPDVLKVKDCLELAMQLYVNCNFLEICYSQNYDTAYLQYLKNEMIEYISKYEKTLLSIFSTMKGGLLSAKTNILQKPEEIGVLSEKIDTIIEPLNSPIKSPIAKMVSNGFDSLNRETRFVLARDGELYIKNQVA